MTVAAPLPRERSLRRIMVGLAPISVAVQLCSFASSIALAHVLGATARTDAYYLALSIPALSYGIFLAALRLGAIPSLTDAALDRRSLARSSSELLSAVVVTSAAVTVVLTGAGELALPWVVGRGPVLGPTRLALLELAPYGVFGAATGAISAVLAVRRSFIPAVAVMALEPIVKTVLTVTLGHRIGTQALIAGNLVGGSLAVLVLWLVAHRSGLRLRLVKRFDSPLVRAAALISVPLLVSQSVLQVNPLIDRAMANGQGAGSVTALELGLRLFAVPAGLLTGLLIAPVTATWATRKASEGWPALQRSVTRAVTACATVAPPFVVLGIVLRHDVVDLLFAGGAYPQAALRDTASVFAMILLGLPAQMLVVAFAALFIVQKDAVLPMKIAGANVVLNVALNFGFRAVYGVPGIALSTSLTYTLLLGVYIHAAYRRWGRCYVGSVWPLFGRFAASTAVTSCVALVLRSALSDAPSRPAALQAMAVVGLAGLAMHTLVLAIVRDPFVRSSAAQLRAASPWGAR